MEAPSTNFFYSKQEVLSFIREAVADSTKAAEKEKNEIIERAQKEKNEMAQKIDQAASAILACTEKVKKQQEEADKKFSKLANDFSEVKEDNTTLKGRIATLAADNKQLKNDMEKQKQEINEHKEKFSIVEGKLKITKGKLREKTEQITEIQQKLKNYEKANQELSEEKIALVNKNIELKNEKEALKAQSDILSKEKAELENRLKANQEEMAEHTKILDEILKCHFELERNSQLQIAEKIQEIAEQKLECQKYRNEVTLTQNESAKAKKERDEALRKLVTEQLAHKVANYNFNKVNADLEQEKTNHELTRINLDISNADLEQEKIRHKGIRLNLSKSNFELRKIKELIRVELESKLEADEESTKNLEKLRQIENNYNKLGEEAQAQRDKIKKFISELSNINLQDPQKFKDWVLNLAKFANLDSKEQKELEIKVSQIQQQLVSPTGLLSWQHLVLQFCNTLITTAIARRVS
ncbi:hypothetical protein [Candidatus Protochlamydia sp. W-9]|uniref:hypothetical protein n=1 Tax=Candidatus Protochlamydia sp. W-9 TaxID=1785087 RepID=UPI00096A8BB7|nr:hypothetical protein [Candidatus Protochlamydia sp. W-9]